jgi:cytochrome c oxidase assembly protein subunit 15
VKTTRRVLVATTAAQALILITGGVVRITETGLGCPTWPRCTHDALLPTEADAVMWIEFGNRLIAGGVVALCVASLVALVRERAGRGMVRLAAAQLAGVLGQAVLGGISVLVELRPLVVAAHLVLPGALVYLSITIATTALRRRPAVASTQVRLAGSVVLVTGLAVVATGTLVTGTGPYAGDATAARLALDPAVVTGLHGTTAIELLLASTAAAWVLARGGAPARPRAALVAVVGLLVLQLAVGVSQVATARPAALVGVHLALAALLIAALSDLHRQTRSSTAPTGAIT